MIRNSIFVFTKFRRLLCFALALCFCFISFSMFEINVYAMPQALNENIALNIINQYSTDNDIHFTIKQTYPLYSISEKSAKYTLFELNPYGYAVLYNDTHALMEASYTPDSSFPIDYNSNKTVYYAGPVKYFVYDGKNYINLFDNSVVHDKDISYFQSREANVIRYENERYHKGKNLSARTVTATNRSEIAQYVGKTYFMNLTKFGDNVDGTCTIIATAMLLGYYDNYVSDLYVPTIYEDGNGTSNAFHLYLNTLVYGTSEPTSGGIYIRNTISDINEYLDAVGITSSMQCRYFLILNNLLTDGIIGKIQNQIPVIASMETERGGPYDHTVLIYGVMYDSSDPNGTACFVSHMGWKDKNTYRAMVLNHSWFYEYGYIECGLNSHDQLTNWSYYNGFNHRATCHCGTTVYESHDNFLLSSGYCTRCKTYVD